MLSGLSGSGKWVLSVMWSGSLIIYGYKFGEKFYNVIYVI